MSLRKRFALNWKQVLSLLIQSFLILLWFRYMNRFELYSKAGVRHHKYDGIYLICGAFAVACMWDNFRGLSRLSRKQYGILSVISVLYSVAVILASYPEFEPFFSVQKFPQTIVSFIGGFIVCFQILVCGVRRVPMFRVSRAGREHPVRFYLLTFFSISAVYLAYFCFVAYPGYFSPDSYAALEQCATEVYNNTSPFWHTLLVKLCLEIGYLFGGSGNSAVCVYGIVQNLMMAAVFAYALVTLYQAGIPRWCIGLVLCMYTFLSYNLAYTATMWKDVPFSVAGLLMVVSLYRLLRDIGKNRILNFCLLALGALAFCLMRTNGWYTLLVSALVLVPVLWKERRQLAYLLCAVLVLGWVCISPMLGLLGVTETDFVEALAVPFQQIARVVVDECDISESDMEMIEDIFYIDTLKRDYDPLTVDPVKFNAFRQDRRDFMKENMGAYIGLWLRLGARHPWEYTKAWVDETVGFWNAGYHYWIFHDGGENPAYGIVRPVMDNPVKTCFDKLFTFLQGTFFITQPFYSIGFHVWMLLYCLVVNAMNKRREFLLAVPIAVIVFGLWIGTPVFAEFRYAYPVFLTVPVILCATVYGEQ